MTDQPNPVEVFKGAMAALDILIRRCDVVPLRGAQHERYFLDALTDAKDSMITLPAAIAAIEKMMKADHIIERKLAFTCERTGKRWEFENTAKLMKAFLNATVSLEKLMKPVSLGRCAIMIDEKVRAEIIQAIAEERTLYDWRGRTSYEGDTRPEEHTKRCVEYADWYISRWEKAQPQGVVEEVNSDMIRVVAISVPWQNFVISRFYDYTFDPGDELVLEQGDIYGLYIKRRRNGPKSNAPAPISDEEASRDGFDTVKHETKEGAVCPSATIIKVP